MHTNEKAAYVLGLTGSIACGKSTVAAYLKDMGARIIDADAISRSLTAPNGAALPAIRAQFGDEVFHKDGTLNRASLANDIFGNIENRRKLEGILHPAVQSETLRQMDEARANGAEVIVLDVPLLFETGMDSLCDSVWVISVDTETQIERVMQRDGKTREQAVARISSQMPLPDKERRADRVIRTDRAMEETQREVTQLYKELLKRL